MLRRARVPLIAALSCISLPSLFGQNVISAKSGLVQYVEGDVTLDGRALSDRAGTFASMKDQSELASEAGRAELLLTPGVFLRVGENSAVRMLDDRISDTRVEVVSGSALVESDTPMKGNSVTMIYKDYTVAVMKHGLYGFETAPAQLKVYAGEALVTYNGQTAAVKEGRVLPFSPALISERFNAKEGDSLYRWSKRRSEYLSLANLSAAKSAQQAKYGGYSLMNSFGGWFFDPFYSMYTYVPFRGTYFSPFGFAYFSPFTVNSFYYPGYYGYGNSGGGGGNSGYTQRGPSAASIQSATAAAGARLSSGAASSSGIGSIAASRGGSAPAPSGGHR